MRVPLRGSDVRRKFIGDEFQGRVVREVEGAALEMRFASNRRNVGSNPMLSAQKSCNSIHISISDFITKKHRLQIHSANDAFSYSCI